MAFNFNWSPLTADEDFYERARDLLTTALNKTPKPPIIVDDILVTELNLGSVPPELEILEIGDLAEDRFRGIFKMCYSGDAFLTLRTRVQVRDGSVFRLPQWQTHQDWSLRRPFSCRLSSLFLFLLHDETIGCSTIGGHQTRLTSVSLAIAHLLYTTGRGMGLYGTAAAWTLEQPATSSSSSNCARRPERCLKGERGPLQLSCFPLFPSMTPSKVGDFSPHSSCIDERHCRARMRV